MKLRCIQSPLERNSSGVPAFSKRMIRECSRKRSTTEITLMFSRGTSEQMPRTTRSIFTPASAAR